MRPSVRTPAAHLLGIAALILALPASLHAAMPLESRAPDPVVISGDDLGDRLLGLPIESLRLLAQANEAGLLSPIPFQIDERDADGHFVLTDGPGASADDDAAELDGNDELVFLAKDAGSRSREHPAEASELVEIRIRDPKSGRDGWVYLAAYREGDAPALSPRRYVDFDADTERIDTDAYQLRFTDPDRPYTLTWTSTPSADGGMGVDFLDSAKLRLTGRLFGLKQVSRTDLDFDSKDRGYRAGPIRLIRVVETRLRLIGWLRAPGADLVRIYYRDWIEAPVPIVLPFKITSFFTEPDVFFGSDYDLPRDGSHRYYSDRVPEGVPIVPGVDASRESRPGDALTWHGVAGPRGAVLSTLRLPSSVPVTVKSVFRVHEDADEPEDVRGAAPLVGQRLVGWDDVPKGRHLAHFYDFFPGAYERGDEAPYLSMLTEPVEFEVLADRIGSTRVTALPAPQPAVR